MLSPRPLFDRMVPPIAVGCAPLASMPDTFTYSVPETIAHATIRTALDSQLNWLDTAAAYGDGESERRIGTVLRDLGGLPDDAFLETKIGADATGQFNATTVKTRLERSLDLLGMNRLNLVFLHDPEQRPFAEITAPTGPLAMLLEYREQGIIQHLGVAGGPIDIMMQYVDTSVFDAVITHNRYTLLDRSAEPLIAHCDELGIPIFNAAPYGSGILAKGPMQYPRYAYESADTHTVQQALAMEAICARYDIPLAATALQFSLKDMRITSTIVGMSRPERIQQTIDLANIVIPDDCWQELDQLANGSR